MSGLLFFLMVLWFLIWRYGLVNSFRDAGSFAAVATCVVGFVVFPLLMLGVLKVIGV